MIKHKKTTIEYISHACVQITYEDTSIITDPWLNEPAFLGSWIPQHKAKKDVEQLNEEADDILITHEHSDHLNEATLRKFHKRREVFVPKIKGDRLKNRVESLGFNAGQIDGGENDVWRHGPILLSCFSSGKLWNDHAFLIETPDTKILNYNDSGINRKVADDIGEVDVLLRAYASGASDYPLCHNHIDEEKKDRIQKDKNEKLMIVMNELVKLHNPDTIMPFASMNQLHLEEHERIAKQQRHQNSIDGVREAVDVDVVNPFEGGVEEIEISDQAKMEIWNNAYRCEDALEPRVIEYFNSFRANEHLEKSPDIDVLIQAFSLHNTECEIEVLVRGNEFEVVRDVEQTKMKGDFDLCVMVPCGILENVIERNLSWDEARIGYWCQIHKTTDKYQQWFWYVLHQPWVYRDV